MSQCGNVGVPKARDAVFIRRVPMDLFNMLVSLSGVLKSMPGEFLPALVILLLVGFRSAAMGLGGFVVQLGSFLVILVMRSVVITSRHLEAPYLPRLRLGFLGKLVSVIGVLQSSFRMPVCRRAIAFFVMFGRRTMGLRR
jgi:hypothetical protein